MDDDEPAINPNQKHQSFLVKLLGRIVRNDNYSNLFKMFISFLIALLSIICADSGDEKGVIMDDDQFNTTTLMNTATRSFGYNDFYAWFFVGIVVASLIQNYMCHNRRVLMIFTLVFYCGHGVFRVLYRHVLEENDFYCYLFYVSQIFRVTMTPLVGSTDSVKGRPQSGRAPALNAIIYAATGPSIACFSAVFLLLNQEKKVLLPDLMYLFVLIVNSKQILKLNDFIKYYVDEEGQEESDETVVENGLNERARPQIRIDHLSKYWVETAQTVIVMYFNIASIFWSPTIVFSYLLPISERYLLALFTFGYGIIQFVYAMVIGPLRVTKFVPHIYVVIFAFLANILIFIIAYFHYDKLTFEALATNTDRFWLSITCLICVDLFLSILIRCNGYYYFLYKESHTNNVFITILNKCFFIPTFYLKINAGKTEQLSILVVASIMAFAAFWYYEKIERNNVFSTARQARPDEGGAELFAGQNQRNAWGGGEENQEQH